MTDQPSQTFSRWAKGSAAGRISEIVIVQALDTPHEVATGDLLHCHLTHLLTEHPIGVDVRLVNVDHARAFKEFVSDLASDAARGRAPLLHVECHGDEHQGLEFPNGSTLSWDDLGRTLEPLNRATRFNLLTVFSACYGAHSVSLLDVVEPAPFWFMVAPTEKADPAEILRGMRVFYRTLIQTLDVGRAAAALSTCDLEHGTWYPMAAQTWFLLIVAGYLEAHCTEDAITKRVIRLKQKALAAGKDIGPARIRRGLRKLNATNPTGSYFDAFFMIDDLPENALRFQEVKVEVEANIQALKKGGGYVL